MSATSSLLISIVDNWTLQYSASAKGNCAWNSGTNTFSINQTSATGRTWENILNQFLNFKSSFYIQQPSNSAILVLSVNGTIPTPSGGVVAIPVTVVQSTGALNVGTICEIGVGPASSLDELSNTAITAPANGEILTYNSTTQKWYNGSGGGGGGGTVTSVTAGTGLTATPNPITSSGTIAISATGVTAGSYTNASITVNAEGQLTAASSGSGEQIHANYGAFAAGQTAVYSSATSQFGNVAMSAFELHFQYDSSATTTPAVGKFSIVDTALPIATIYFNATTLEGLSVGTYLSSLPAANVFGCVTTPTRQFFSFTSDGTLAGSVVHFSIAGVQNNTYANNDYVTFVLDLSNTLYIDRSNNVSINDLISFSGSNNTVYGANPSSTTVFSGNNNTAFGHLALDPSANFSGSSNVAVGASASVTANISQNVVVGASSSIASGNSVVIGHNSSVGTGCNNAIVIGEDSQIPNTAGPSSILIGQQASLGTSSQTSVCIGQATAINSVSGVIVGQGCTIGTNSDNSTVLGQNSSVANNANNSLVLGSNSTSSHSGAVLIGDSCLSHATNTLHLASMSVLPTASGGTAAIPALAVEYLVVYVNGALRKIALFNN